MATVLSISQLGNPVLRQVAQPICHVQEDWVQTLANNLILTLLSHKGVGIAAPQVANLHRILVVASHPNARYPNAPEMEPTVMINPRLLDYSDATISDWEGCLSVPGIRGLVNRHKEVEVEFTGLDGHVHQAVLTGFPARIFQHEFDHLNGILFLDRMESLHDLITEQEYLRRVMHADDCY